MNDGYKINDEMNTNSKQIQHNYMNTKNTVSNMTGFIQLNTTRKTTNKMCEIRTLYERYMYKQLVRRVKTCQPYI